MNWSHSQAVSDDLSTVFTTYMLYSFRVILKQSSHLPPLVINTLLKIWTFGCDKDWNILDGNILLSHSVFHNLGDLFLLKVFKIQSWMLFWETSIPLPHYICITVYIGGAVFIPILGFTVAVLHLSLDKPSLLDLVLHKLSGLFETLGIPHQPMQLISIQAVEWECVNTSKLMVLMVLAEHNQAAGWQVCCEMIKKLFLVCWRDKLHNPEQKNPIKSLKFWIFFQREFVKITHVTL